MGALTLLLEPRAVRLQRFGQAQLGGSFAQALDLHVEIAHLAELAGDPLQLLIQAAGLGRQDVAEEAQRGAQAAGRDAHLVHVPRIVATASPGRLFQKSRPRCAAAPGSPARRSSRARAHINRTLYDMDLYLVRHAEAGESDYEKWPDDAARPLTPEGEKRFRRAAKGLRELGVTVDVVLSSPWVRAWRTAELLEKEARWPQPLPCEALGPAARRPKCCRRCSRSPACSSVALVGHEPSLHELTSYLLTADTGHAQVEMGKGGVARLEVGDGLRPGAAHGCAGSLDPRGSCARSQADRLAKARTRFVKLSALMLVEPARTPSMRGSAAISAILRGVTEPP